MTNVEVIGTQDEALSAGTLHWSQHVARTDVEPPQVPLSRPCGRNVNPQGERLIYRRDRLPGELRSRRRWPHPTDRKRRLKAQRLGNGATNDAL